MPPQNNGRGHSLLGICDLSCFEPAFGLVVTFQVIVEAYFFLL
jgi:hypothetical protein